MARYPFEEFTKVVWVPGASGIANIAAPTVAEIAAGTDITCFLTKDGLNLGGTTNKVDQGGLCDHVDGDTVGTVKFDASLKGYRDNAAGGDDYWDLGVWGSAGHLVVRRGILFGTAFAAAQKVEVYKGQLGQKVPATSAANTNQTADIPLAVAAANLDATVAA